MSDVGGIERKAATTTKPDTGISVIVGFDAAGKQHRVLSSVTQVVNFYFDGRLDDRKTQVAVSYTHLDVYKRQNRGAPDDVADQSHHGAEAQRVGTANHKSCRLAAS